MKRKILLILTLILSLNGWGHGYIDISDYVTIDFPDTEVPQGGRVEMVVTWNNKANNPYELTAFQIEFILPDGIELVDAQLGEMITTHNPKMDIAYTSHYGSDNHSGVVAFQIDTKPMPVGECELMRLTFEVAEYMELGNYDVSTTNIMFANHEETFVLPTHTFRFIILEYQVKIEPIVGDVNNDGELTLSDATCIISWLLEEEPQVFEEDLADFNGDGHITNSDAVAIIMHILNNANTTN